MFHESLPTLKSYLKHYHTHTTQHKSFKTLIKWMWDERTCCTFGDGPDASRASVLDDATWAWPSNDQVRTWLENWGRWEREQPAW